MVKKKQDHNKYDSIEKDLSNYMYFQRELSGIDYEIIALKEQQDSIRRNCPGADISKTRVQGGDKTSVVEIAAIKIEKIEEEIRELNFHKEQTFGRFIKLKEALDNLSSRDYTFIVERYLNRKGRKVKTIYQNLGYSEDGYIKARKRILEMIASEIENTSPVPGTYQ